MITRKLNTPLIGIIADDLTSAADGASPFIARGMRASVWRVRRESIRGLFENATENVTEKVIAIDCGSRSMSKDEAVQSVAQATALLANAPILLKTIDSTLRGHVAVEIGAAAKASGRERIILAPAFPDAGRTTQNGIQRVNGIPVSETAYASDPVHPATTSRISDLIPRDLNNVVILDAESQEDLNRQVAAIENPESVLWIGSPGIAIALAEAQIEGVDVFLPKPLPHAERTLIVVGSANPVSRAQLDYVKEADLTTCLCAPKVRLNDPHLVLANLASQATRTINEGKFGALIATGGDTMEAMLDKLHIDQFSLIGEFEPGFPIGQAKLSDGRNLVLAMKAGGFGEPETLLLAAQRLRASPHHQYREKIHETER